MKLIFLGAGSSFTVDNHNFNSNMLLVDPKSNAKLLIDCGYDARLSLHKQGYTHSDITDVYISHLHADHSGGLEWLAINSKQNGVKPNLYANRDIIQDLWEKTLSGGMMTLVGQHAQLSDFFTVHETGRNGSFIWNGIPFQTVQTVHIFHSYSLMPSYGLIFTLNGLRIFITTDTQFIPLQLNSYYANVDIIFQDCETHRPASGVHAHFDQLKDLDPYIKAKMWLYHYSPGALPDAKAHGFCGFVKPGQMFEF